jgi:hypothetical protein
MRLKKGFILREICGEKAIVAEGVEVINFNKLLSVNDTAAFIWQNAASMGDFTAEQLTDKVCETYDVDRERALSDVKACLAQWQEIGVME